MEFNGIDAGTGGYLFPAQSPADIARTARRSVLPRELAAWTASFVRDLDDLAQTGWGLVVPDGLDAAIIDALCPLLDLRAGQAGAHYRELVVRPGEDKSTFLRRNGMGPGPADPRRVPYYLLIVGPPALVPYSFQYLLDVQYAVGRVDFDTVAEYAAYARHVVAAEERGVATVPAHLFATSNPDDEPTGLSARKLAEPLARELTAFGAAVTKDVGAPATKQRLRDLLAGGPGILFTATHGLGSRDGDARDVQGALVCQDWPGPLAAQPIEQRHYLCAADVVAPVVPRVVFSFACYSGGFAAHVSRLPQRLLVHGALAFVGHVDRAWGYSFLWDGADEHITAMVSAVLSLHEGHRLGTAMEAVNCRWSEIAAELTTRLDQLGADDRRLAWLWTACNDARNYVVVGDPAVRAC
ncbi:hypothetical protein [Lentzea tibetensis]|uniref:hypothetical protein n=1 Tax=Lentzea tibetensis TaxID=2591470 RepID=UPI001F44EF5A|nr:hypothetical protein [Lentzea tibetensis]